MSLLYSNKDQFLRSYILNVIPLQDFQIVKFCLTSVVGWYNLACSLYEGSHPARSIYTEKHTLSIRSSQILNKNIYNFHNFEDKEVQNYARFTKYFESNGQEVY